MRVRGRGPELDADAGPPVRQQVRRGRGRVRRRLPGRVGFQQDQAAGRRKVKAHACLSPSDWTVRSCGNLGTALNWCNTLFQN